MERGCACIYTMTIHTHSLFPLPNLDSDVRRGGSDLLPWIHTPCLAKQSAQDGNGGKQDHKDDGDIEDQSLYAAPSLEDSAGAIAAERASQSSPTHLEQDEEDDDDAQYYLNNANCWKPLCSQSFPPLCCKVQGGGKSRPYPIPIRTLLRSKVGARLAPALVSHSTRCLLVRCDYNIQNNARR